MSNPTETANNPQSKPDGISINVRHGLPHLTVALPSRNEKCVFVLRPITHTIGDLLEYSPEKLQELKNFGQKSADEVFTNLKNKLGIILK